MCVHGVLQKVWAAAVLSTHNPNRCYRLCQTGVPCPTHNMSTTLTRSLCVCCRFLLSHLPHAAAPADTIAPTINAPDVTVDATGVTTQVFFAPTAQDNVDPIVKVTCNPVTGSNFTVGVTVVTCNATDQAGNTARRNFTVTVGECWCQQALGVCGP